jgi:cysteinyl-tRNA synthetase
MQRQRSRSPARGVADTGVDTAEILRLIFEREQARLAKDWGSADSLRERLSAIGVSIFDKTNSWKTIRAC